MPLPPPEPEETTEWCVHCGTVRVVKVQPKPEPDRA